MMTVPNTVGDQIGRRGMVATCLTLACCLCATWQPAPAEETLLPANRPTTVTTAVIRPAAATVSAQGLGYEYEPGAADRQTGQYGPGPLQPRGTLLQWSYGTSFTGGPNLDEPLVTDRPDFTEASSTVGRDVAQIEFGYTYAYDSEGGVSTRTSSLGEPLLRYGIFEEWLELRLALFPVEQRVKTGAVSNTTAGTEDLYFGFKIGLTPQEGLLPEMALIPQMTLPTGSSAFTTDDFLPGVNWIYSWEVNDFISTAGSTQFNPAIDDRTGNSYNEWAQSWTVAYSLSEELGAYTEWFALFPHSAESARTEHYFNGGFTYLISNDVQWDIRAGWGLNNAASDFFAGTGLSIRFH